MIFFFDCEGSFIMSKIGSFIRDEELNNLPRWWGYFWFWES